MQRGVVEQEKDLKDLIRRAKGNPDKTGALRRDTLKRLIELTQSPQPSLKILAAEGIQHFFKDFPDLEEASINSVYDLCEDQSTTVRIEGYKALAQLSRAQPRWVKRNADVLLQLLQSDEPDEVIVVRQALVEHTDLDPQVTFGVLCDQLLPPEDAIDEEEQGIRDRLRGLVLSFLATDAKHCVERRIAPGSPAEDVLHRGLLAVLPKLGTNEVEKIVKEILFLLPSYASQSSLGQALLQSILQRTSEALRTALRASGKPVSLGDTHFFLDLANFIAVEKKAAPALDLLVFYLTSLTSKMTLQRLSKEDQSFIISRVADAFRASGHADPRLVSEQLVVNAQRQAVDACPILLERLVENSATDTATRGACITLLTECVRRKNDASWTVPPRFLSTLERIKASPLCNEDDNQARHIQGLIRSLAPSIAVATRRQDTPISLTKPSIAKVPLTQSSSTTSTRRQSLVNLGTAASSASLITKPEPSVSQDDTSRPSKRLKQIAEPSTEVPSLLSRMGNASSSSGAGKPRNTLTSLTRPQPKIPASNITSGTKEVLSIKGAALRHGESVAGVPAVRPAAPSLLNRLHNGNANVNHDTGGTGLGPRPGKRKGMA